MDLVCPSCGARLDLVLKQADPMPEIVAPPPVPAPVTDSIPQLISVAEAAQRLSISRAKLHAELAAGRIPSLKIGGRRLVPLRQLHEFIQAAISPAAPPYLAPRRPDPQGVARGSAPHRASDRAPMAHPQPRRSAPSPPPLPAPAPVPWSKWMSAEEHRDALAALAKRGWPEDVLQHMRDEEIGPYTIGLPEVARRLGLAKSTVYKMVKEGTLPIFRDQRSTYERPQILIGVRRLAGWVAEQQAHESGAKTRLGRPRGRKTGQRDPRRTD